MTVQIDDSSNQTPRTKTNTSRPWAAAILRGFSKKCPSCGKGSLYASFLKINESCPHCDEELHHHRADDAPPYFTIFILGHILLPMIIVVEKLYRPEVWVHLSIWFPLTVLLTLFLLPRVKGATLALQWALCMHGFEYAAVCAPLNRSNDKMVDPAE